MKMYLLLVLSVVSAMVFTNCVPMGNYAQGQNFGGGVDCMSSHMRTGGSQRHSNVYVAEPRGYLPSQRPGYGGGYGHMQSLNQQRGYCPPQSSGYNSYNQSQNWQSGDQYYGYGAEPFRNAYGNGYKRAEAMINNAGRQQQRYR